MFFTPKPVPKRVSGGVVCLMLVMLGGALFAGFDLMGSVESRGLDPGVPIAPSRGPDKVRATNVTGTAAGTGNGPTRADAFVAIGQATIKALAAVITRIVTEWWPTALVLDWMQVVHRVWPPTHRLPGTGLPQS